MRKLHELLAVEPDLKAEAQRVATQVKKLFTEGKGRLIGETRIYRPLEEGGQTLPDERKELTTTVLDELKSVESAYAAWLDTAIQKETTNQDTKADVVIGDETILEGLPATALLNLESKLAELRQIFNLVPTNDPAEKWEWDEQAGHFISRERVTLRTQKVPKAHVLYPASKEHPAQVQAFTEDVYVGEWTTTIRSGMVTPQGKKKMLARLDALARAVKAARQRANDVTVSDIHVAKKLFAYLFGE